MLLGTAWRDGDKLTKPGMGTRGGRKTRDPNSPSHSPPKDVQKKITERNCFVLKSLFLYREDKN